MWSTDSTLLRLPCGFAITSRMLGNIFTPLQSAIAALQGITVVCSVAHSNLHISVSSTVTELTTNRMRLTGAEIVIEDGSMIVVLPIPAPDPCVPPTQTFFCWEEHELPWGQQHITVERPCKPT